MALATLTIDINARLASIEKDMGRAAQIAEANAKRMEEAFAKVGDVFAAIGGAAAITALGAIVKQTADAADALGKLSQKTGVAVENLSRLQYAASLSDVTTDDLATSLARLARGMADTAQGTGSAKDAFAALGIDVKNASGALKSTDQVFTEIAQRMSEYKDSAEKSAIAQEIFGKSGANLIPLLNSGAAGLREMGDEAERFGVVMSADLAKASEEFNDNLTRINTQLQGAKNTISAQLIPVLVEASEHMIGFGKANSAADAAGAALRTTLETITVLGANVAYVFKAVGVEIGGLAAQAAAIARLDFSGAAAIGRMMKEDAALARKEIDEFSARVMSASKATGEFKKSVEEVEKPTLKFAAAAEKSDKATKKAGDTAKKAGRDFDELGEFIKDLEWYQSAAAKSAEELARNYNSTIGAVEDRALALERELETYGQTESQIEATTLARLGEVRVMAKANGATDDYIAGLDREIAARRRIVAATAGMEVRKANIEAAQAASDEWQRTADTIEQSLTDALMRGFEDGKDFAENFRDSLINLFKTLILRPIIQPIAQGASGMIMGATGMSGGQGGGMGGGMGGLGNAYSAYNNASIGYQWASGSMSTANAFGTMYANATGTGLDGLLATNGAYGTAPAAGGFSMAGLGGAGAGAYLGYQLTGGNLGGAALGGVAGYGAASGIASGAGAYSGMAASLGAIPVWGWIAIAALAIYSATAKGGTPHLGAAVLTGEDDSQRLLRHEEQIGDEQVWGGFKGAEEALTEPLKSIGLGAAKTIEDTLANFGIDKQVSVFSAFGADDDDPSRGILRVFGEDGSVMAENTSDGNRHRGVKYDDDPQKGFEQFVDDGGRVIRDALVAADLPGWVDDILLSLGDAPGLALVNQTIAQINTIKKTAETLGPALGITAEGLAGIVENTGNLDTAISLLNTYAELSLTSAEKWSFAQRSLVDGFDDLGVAVPKSTDEFERLLRGIDQTSDAGQELYTGLLALAPAFYNVAGAVEEAFASISKSTADLVQKFQMDVMTDSERYAYFDSQIAILDAKIDAATDPTELASLIDERNQALLSAWNLLTDEQKAANLPAFTDIAMDGESSAQARLSVTPIDSPESEAKRSEKIAEEAQKTRDAITTGIANGMERVAEMFTTSSGNLDAAAAKLRESASELRASVGGSFSSGGEVVYG